MLSARTQYACLALAQLAGRENTDKPIQAGRIAELHGIPSTFLVQILHELKRAGFVASTRGASGGYRLACPAETTTLAEVVDVFEPSAAPEQCAAGASPLAPVVESLCQSLVTARRERLAEITLADLANGLNVEVEPMWYI